MRDTDLTLPFVIYPSDPIADMYAPKPPKDLCPHCKREFRTDDAMKRHLTTKHGDK